MVALRRIVPLLRPETDLAPQLETVSTQVTGEDFLAAYKMVEPTSTREFLSERPRLGFKDVGGLAQAKRTLGAVVRLAQSPAVLGAHRFNPPKGILLTGPSGTGKTLLARAAAGELGLTLITVDQPGLLSKWVGESEKGLHEVFKRARQTSPCILLLDEVEALAPARTAGDAGGAFPRLVSQLFRELDALHGSLGVTVLGATNRPDLLDPALLRAGRFDYVLELPFPDVAERRDILAIHTEGLPLADDVNLEELSRMTPGFTGADLELCCKKAAIAALQDRPTSGASGFRVAWRHLREAHAVVAGMVVTAGRGPTAPR